MSHVLSATIAPSIEDISEVVKRIQGAGKRVNLDFIYGLPEQSIDGFRRSIERAIEMRPNRLVTFPMPTCH